MKLFISPHNDDETLFAAFTIMKEKPHICIVFDSYVQVQRGNPGADWQTRRNETLAAMMELGIKGKLSFLALRDDAPDYEQFHRWLRVAKDQGQFDGIICPAWEQDGHEQHNGVARVCRDLWPDEQRTEYLTYTRTAGRSRSVKRPVQHLQGQWADADVAAHEVIPTPDMIARKHRALACYKSQMEVENCRSWFMSSMEEFLV